MLKEALKDVLDSSEIALLSSSFDVIGDIAIIKIPEALNPKRQAVAQEILFHMKNVTTVLKQSSDVQGEFRTREVGFIAGQEKYDTVYKENGCLFKVNVRDVFFSPRLSTERERISKLVGNGEKIFNMFAGIGTFSIVIAKQKDCIIESVDTNPRAIELARESLLLNKNLKGRVNPILSDALLFAKEHRETFDRVLMPLPEQAHKYLSCAFDSAKQGATIHYYLHVAERDFYSEGWIEENVKEILQARSHKIAKWKKVREVGPRYIQAVADIVKL
ncbi:MAG: class I SAM-dependent methyltransferase [Nitrososphaerales archaeon]